MSGLTIPSNSNILAGANDRDDAGVYKINSELALVQTLDFITPICDDPFEFGKIAACNSLSDVYAMGGKPITAMNIVSFPLNKFSLDILNLILKGGLTIMKEGDVQLLGGHSVDDPELKYGLSVTGTIHPERIIRNNGIKPDDLLVLTKPLGTGIIATALKGGVADKEITDRFIKSMSTLNKTASEIMLKYNVNAATDITGFGLIGHILEMTEGNDMSVILDSNSIPILDGALEYASEGLIPGGLYRNKNYAGSICAVSKNVKQERSDIMFDPQTSGGLLISLPKNEAELMVKEMHGSGITHASIIGEVKALDRRGVIVS
jgi:selenide,water dikinase